MLWNLMMHGLMGWLGAWYFLPTTERIWVAILVVCMTQAADQVRVRKEKFARVESMPEQERAEAISQLEHNLKRILAITYVQNVVIHTVVVLLVAHAARINGWI